MLPVHSCTYSRPIVSVDQHKRFVSHILISFLSSECCTDLVSFVFSFLFL